MTSSAADATTALAKTGRRIETQNNSNRSDKNELLMEFEINSIPTKLCGDTHVMEVLAVIGLAPKAAPPKAHEKKNNLEAID